jgi:beta-galactosidase GanA
MRRNPVAIFILLIFSATAALYAQVKEAPLPRLVKKDGRFALFVDDAPFLMLGAQINNSSAWPAMLPKVWPAIQYLHANTVEMPVYWEQLEPRQGQFDYSVVDTLLTQAREHHVRLVLLWFGTWKNGSQHYMPEWMKLEPGRYFHVVDKNGHAADSPSPYATASLEADKLAFAALMRHLKAADPQRTVVMVQVENESGTWGSVRDYSHAAQKLFEGPVPPEVVSAMHAPSGANWQAVFGPEAEVDFHAWSVARYVGQVAAAGKAAYPLPMYANAALRDPIKPGAPGSYESGGPTDNVIPIWKVAAPAIDIEAPDVYMSDSVPYLKVLELYHRDDNALFVPETGGNSGAARFFFSALGLQAIGFSPFGMDYTGNRGASAKPEEFLEPWARNYELIGPMDREIARLNFEGKLQAVAEEKGKPEQLLSFGPWTASVSYGTARNRIGSGNPEPIGRALVAQLGDNRFLVAGFYCRVEFRPTDASGDKHRQFLKVEEGAYSNGVFKPIRIWNGDQTDWGLNFTSEPVVLRVSLATYSAENTR